jgi:hypothetical protein
MLRVGDFDRACASVCKQLVACELGDCKGTTTIH